MVFAATLGLVPEVWAQPPNAEEYTVKTAFIFNFAKFTEWPDESFPEESSPMTICILGVDPFGTTLDAIRSKMVGNRKTVVKQISGIEEMNACHILFISDSERERLTPILETARKVHVLTISDMGRFDRSGGMILLFRDGDKIRFSINAGAAKRAGIKLSSQILKLAVTVKE